MKDLAPPLVKGLLFAVITVLATAVLATTMANVDTRGTARYTARFTDVTSLRENDEVRVAGVRVGQVEQVGLGQNGVAEVEFSVLRERILPASTTAKIKYRNLVGQRYLTLERGAEPASGTLRPGGTIPLARTTPAVDLTALFNGFKPLFQALDPHEVNRLSYEIVQVLQGEGGTVRGLLAHIGSLTSSLAAKDEVIGRVVDDLNTVLGTVNARDEQLSDLVTNTQLLVSGLAADREVVGSAISGLAELTGSTAGLLEQGREPLEDDVAELGRLSGTLAANTPVFQEFLDRLPAKYDAVGRTASYGSWLNLYLCAAAAPGVPPAPNGPPQVGFPVTETRCLR
ncbi:MCE family protein [Saccharopolyspora sp. NFXS83]|uniref:MCE family protein n=1 Tax=Saccharopolyspora sp. NFXS83 TaxID=2993560 RepID=UPI00224AA512|nr:MCE family protein [Saccharopolyspora sp. NFXS83]MCX2729596.1 MCE family protein [Saccharopolyspora sp. NFXS83]